MDDGAGRRARAPPAGTRCYDYEDLLAARRARRVRTSTDENQAASMCYTSGTTGNPKGVVYTPPLDVPAHDGRAHRRQPRGLRARHDPAGRAHVPRQRLGPGPRRGGVRRRPGDARARPVARRRSPTLIESEQVTVAAGVPTIWMGVLPELKGRDTSRLRAIPCGGSAVPKALSEALPRADRPAHPPGVGHDRDQPGRVDRAPSRATCADARRGRAGRPARHRRAIASVGVDFRVVDAGPLEPSCRGTARPGRAAGRGARGSPASTTTTTARPSRSPTTAGSRPATSPPSTPRATSASSTAPRTW